MKDFHELICVIKIHLSKDIKRKVFDKEVAEALQLSQANFATLKKRNSTPYENIILFCKDKNICSNELFFS